MVRNFSLPLIAALVAAGLFSSSLAFAAGPDAKLYQTTVDKGVQYLLTKGQAADGSFSAQAGPAVTAMAAYALMRSGRSSDDPAVAKALKYVEQSVQSGGGIHGAKSRIPNYETCLAMQCFAEANKDGRYEKLLNGAEKYVKEVQADTGEGQNPSDFTYGGSGYGKVGRPDLSNTAFLVDALHDIGRGGDDEAMQKALIFVSRCQNLESEHNTTPQAAKNPDGGFFYTVSDGGKSPAGETDDGGFRSYGTMTYAGLKSMIFAGLKPDDLRVKAAVKWLQKNYSVKQNPGMGTAGLFYYYHTFAKCLSAMGEDTFADDKGIKHDWRQELVAELAGRQNANGSWTNNNTKWMEGDPNLVTAYALLSLSYCQPTKAK